MHCISAITCPHSHVSFRLEETTNTEKCFNINANSRVWAVKLCEHDDLRQLVLLSSICLCSQCYMHTTVQINSVALVALPLPSHSASVTSTQNTLNLICRWLLLIPTDCTLPILPTSPYMTSQKTKYYTDRRALNCGTDKKIMG